MLILLLDLRRRFAIRRGRKSRGGHMTFSVEISRRLDLQLGSFDIAVDGTSALDLQQVLDLNGARHFSQDIRGLAVDITLDIPIGADDHLGRAMDVPYKGAVDSKIAVARDVPFHGCAGADQAGTRAYGLFAEAVRFGFAVKHIIWILITDFLGLRHFQGRRIQLHSRPALQHIPYTLQILIFVPYFLL